MLNKAQGRRAAEIRRPHPSAAGRASGTERASLLRAIALGTALTVITSAILLIDLLPSNRVLLNAGDVSPEDILAPADLTYDSVIRTQQAQEAQAAAVQEFFDPPDASVARQQELRARQILEYISTVRADTYASHPERQQSIIAIPDFELPPDIATQMLTLSEEEWQEVKDDTVSVLLQAMQGEIRESQIEAVRRRLPIYLRADLTAAQTSIVTVLTSGLVRANTLYNAARTEEARQQARQNTPPVTMTFRQGEAIVRAGDQVRPIDIEELDAFGLRQPVTRWQSLVGTVLFSVIATTLLELFVLRLQPTLWARARTATVTVLLIAAFIVTGKLMLLTTEEVVPYLYPLPALSMILTLLFGPALGMAVGVMVGFVGVFVAGGSLEITTYLLAGTLMGALTLGRAERLKSFLQAGTVVALTNAAVVVVFGLLTPDENALKVAIDALVGIVMGGLAASLTLAAFFALSSLLDVVTPFQLLELARPNNALFRQLLLKAPGTYHHTLLVSNMAEEAANRVGADGLLARVGSYYHDVGKTARPYFFAENRVREENPHDRLDPHTSAQIIISHVQDGIDLAEKYHLPPAIRAFIPEHHGTGLALAFYRLAAKAANDSGQSIDEKDFRYPGPKPQSKETAIVMLADGCEARVRSARPGSVEEIDTILRETLKSRLDAGELDECDLTLRDLDRIRHAFLDVLQGVFHPRVQYPEPVKVRRADGQEIIR